MRVRIIGLAAAAVLILGGGLYLFLQVTSDPATAASTVATRDDRPDPRVEPPPQEPGKGPMFRPPRTGSATIEPVQPKIDRTGSTASTGTSGQAPALETGDEVPSPDVDLDAAMDEANKLYNDSDYEGATRQALRVLGKSPGNVRMLRVVVSSGCMMGDVDQATKYYDQLPPSDQSDMARRCERFEIHFKPTAGKAKTP
jgi:hypothetical protein